jgi:hypothetical protein
VGSGQCENYTDKSKCPDTSCEWSFVVESLFATSLVSANVGFNKLLAFFNHIDVVVCNFSL